MKTLTLFQARADVAEICGEPPQVMDMPGALELAVPHDDWLLFEFFPFWTAWKRSLGEREGGHYQPGSGMCEWLTREFLQRLAVSCRKAHPGRNWNPCAFEAGMGIPAGYALNGVTDGGHAPILICTHTESSTNESEPLKRRWYVAESQAWTLDTFRTPLDEAVRAGVRLVTVRD